MLVYKYRLAPHEGIDVMFAQLRLAHAYRNTLTAIENGRRDAVRAAELTYGNVPSLVADLDRANVALDTALTDVRRARSDKRKRCESPEQKAAVKAARDARKVAVGALREARAHLQSRCQACRQVDPHAVTPCAHASADAVALFDERARIADVAAGLRRNARAYSGLGEHGPYTGAWGTYLLVEAAMEQACKTTPLYAPDGVTPQNVRFLRWTGEGGLGVQIQGGATVVSVLAGENAQLQIAEPHIRSLGRSRQKLDARHGIASLRLALIGGESVYGSWRMDMFRRPLPAGATIKRATAHRVRYGARYRWYLTITLDNAPSIAAPLRSSKDVVAVDVGWRVVGDEIRVATWRDLAGRTGELRLDATDIRLLRAPQDIRSERDGRLEALKQRLGTWLARSNTPGWLSEHTGHIYLWRTPKRMMELRRMWADRRFDRDDIAFADLDAFCTQDTDAWTAEAAWRERALLRRREKYRIFAADLANRYSTLVLESDDAKKKVFDMTPLVVHRDENENETARSNRFIVATYQLRDSMLNAFRRRDRSVALIPARDTTRTCHVCGLVEARDAAASIQLVCDGCGSRWDQDDNADVILLRRFEQSGDAEPGGGARGRGKRGGNEGLEEGKWARAKRIKGEKDARRGGARKAGDEAAE